MSNLLERHQQILELIKKEGSIKVNDLCTDFNVSSVTIRKDLQFLEDRNLLYRTHGGATLSNPYIADRHVDEKVALQAAEKHRIGEFAAKLIEPNDCILIASGTTVQFFAKNIFAKDSLTVVTSALNVALELMNHQNVEVIQLGGIMRKTSASVTGVYAENLLKDFSCSKLFLGVDGIDLEFGLTTSNMMEALLNKKMIEASQKTIVLVDSSKFGKRGFGKICGLEDIEQIITDSNISEHTVNTLESMGVEVTVL
ncbi:MAG TPA: DeoR/GlpR family DNA-binding transcription regulator [Niabella sp.]|nr:DeoR/GlpR family DNA-binding transcription regulator [Niabella sp.]HOZ96657.1 DeoR/GlpR family DNA-binding transcription regulator [Niabella sp.]HQW14475.1 DeoR/GlpR family DNA-binding transcription regulator [Niabella sp.]HQX19890.1 DeoR/GlpR family DNA-binding transcription regulator [Niabella sp.]HRB07328.1 DeoR/GlpR family DNA-binding transcription regulator [Niabella sp.]